jgi:hypothetical protein
MQQMAIDRSKRRLLQLGLLAGIAPSSIIGCSSAQNVMAKESRILGCIKSKQGFAMLCVDSEGDEQYRIPLSTRGHGLTITPINVNSSQRDAALFLRRPGSEAIIFDVHTGAIKQSIQAEYKRYFYGHGVYSSDGRFLYATQGVRKTSQGIVAVFDANDSYKKVDEWSGFGLGPHEIVRLKNDVIAVAVGGLHTDEREILNVDSMQPKLVYFSSNGALLQSTQLAEHQASIRHLSATASNQIVLAQQLNGDAEPNTPLIHIHSLGMQPLPLLATELEWLRFNQYIGSVATSELVIVATSPRGNCVGIWDMQSRRLLKLVSLMDASGVSYLNGQFSITSGTGKGLILDQFGKQLGHFTTNTTKMNKPSIAWDNHCLSV